MVLIPGQQFGTGVEIPAGADLSDPNLISQQLGRYAVATPGQQPANPPNDPLPPAYPGAPPAEPPTPGTPEDAGDIRTTADLASIFNTDEGTTVEVDDFFGAVTHQIGDQEFTLKEIVDGFVAQPDAAQALAQRDGLETEFQMRSNQQAQLHSTAMQALAEMQARLKSQIDADADPVAMAELLRRDPHAYQQAQIERTAKQAQWETNDAELRRQQDAANKSQQDRNDEWESQEARALNRTFPEYTHPTTGPAVKAQLDAYAQGLGFTQQELGALKDHRFMLVLRDAAMGAAMRDKGRTALKQAKDKRLAAPAAKQAARGELPGARDTENKSRADAFKQLTRSHSVKDAGALFARIV